MLLILKRDASLTQSPQLHEEVKADLVHIDAQWVFVREGERERAIPRESIHQVEWTKAERERMGDNFTTALSPSTYIQDPSDFYPETSDDNGTKENQQGNPDHEEGCKGTCEEGCGKAPAGDGEEA